MSQCSTILLRRNDEVTTFLAICQLVKSQNYHLEVYINFQGNQQTVFNSEYPHQFLEKKYNITKGKNDRDSCWWIFSLTDSSNPNRLPVWMGQTFLVLSIESQPDAEKLVTFHPESPWNVSHFNTGRENKPKGCFKRILVHFNEYLDQ